MSTTNESVWHKITPDTYWPPDFFRGNSVEVITPSGHLRTMLYEPPDSDWIKDRAQGGCWFRSLYLPAPPKEQTQCERDSKSFCEWRKTVGVFESFRHPADAEEAIWHSALAWERAEIAKLLNIDNKAVGSDWLFSADKLAAIRARLRP